MTKLDPLFHYYFSSFFLSLFLFLHSFPLFEFFFFFFGRWWHCVTLKRLSSTPFLKWLYFRGRSFRFKAKLKGKYNDFSYILIPTHGCDVLCLVAQSWPILYDPMDCSLPGSSVRGDSPSKNTGVGCHALLQGIYLTHDLNRSLSHCRWILYCLNHQGSPRILEWVAYPL